MCHLRDDLGGQPRFDLKTSPLRGPRNGLLQLLHREGRHRVGPGRKEISELPIKERSIVEVTPEGDHHPYPASGVGDRGQDDPQKPGPDVLVVDEAEHLLELIDHKEELRFIGRKDLLGDVKESVVAPVQLLHEPGRRIHRDGQERRFELLEWMGTGEHVHDEPAVRSWQRAARECRDEAGPHHGGLPAP
ncbi:MAG TPA: hypothetical protein VFH81_01320, partial [Actinomycetota bacterium]|nr:hypothetical protein [Actinomycetota bacterium]